LAVTLHILGAGGSYPPPGYAGPSLLLEAPDSIILLDCGDSCVSRLMQAGFDPCEVDEVYISHRHADHWSGIVQFLSTRGARGCGRVRVVASGDVAGELAALIAPITPGNSELIVEPVREPWRLGGGIEASLFRTVHQVPTYGVRVREGGERLLVYTADTSAWEGLAGVLRGYRLAVMDSTLTRAEEEGPVGRYHMSPSTAWEVARSAGVSLVVAFHLSPESLAEARRLGKPGLLVPGELSSISL
jgi:ribonuclease BN (tRNA processing enzyme)